MFIFAANKRRSKLAMRSILLRCPADPPGPTSHTSGAG
jgi:hypothetical protein